MAFYSYAFTANYKRFFTKLKAVAKKENRSFLGLVLDTGWSVFHHGLALTEYLNYEFYRRNRDERKQYVGVRMQNSFYETVSPSAHKLRYTFKPTFMKEFAAYTKRDFLVPDGENYEQFLDFLHSREAFMAKPYDGLAGHGVEKIHTKDLEDPRAYYDFCVKNRIFLEDLVIQHEGMNVLCPASVNTLRILTFNDHGTPRILWMGVRIGNGVNAVDNFHAKGMVCSVNMETGRLEGNAIDKDNVVFDRHPTTGVVFDGFQIPCFAQIKELVLQAALESDKILVVGWDVAISNNGPVIIEGNRRPGFDIIQVMDGRGRRDIVDSVLGSLEK